MTDFNHSTNVQKNCINLNDIDINIYSAIQIKDNIKELYLNGLPEGLKIGLKSLDERFRLSLSSLCVLTGIPGRGKSEFCDFVISQFNKLYGYKTAIYSPENQPIGLHIAKIFSKLLSKEFKNTEIPEVEFERTLNYFTDNFYIMDYQKTKSLEEILETSQKLIDSKDIKILVLDSYNERLCFRILLNQ
ncbi:hypothetical protein EZS27_018660 [termite gut metagenome]|uniref:Uncharacterized protein n=1 Tax=termite gut metagenome TaxID=433724 RepID=A0A5J4RH11_9ZZZZ